MSGSRVEQEGGQSLTSGTRFAVAVQERTIHAPINSSTSCDRLPSSHYMNISVSTTFFPSARLPGSDGMKPDLIVYTSDSVFFYVHQAILKSKSKNNFRSLLVNAPPVGVQHSLGASTLSSGGGSAKSAVMTTTATPPGSPLQSLSVPEVAAVINVLLHIIYGMSCERYGPSLETLNDVLHAMHTYGLPPLEQDDSSDIQSALLRHAHASPLKAYALAAAFGLESVCVAASRHSLQMTLDGITEADALIMGPIYIRRMYRLHANLGDLMKELIGPVPASHQRSNRCSEEEQSLVSKAWRRVVADILLQPCPQGMTTSELSTRFLDIRKQTDCPKCSESIQNRIASVVDGWDAAQKTI